MKPVLKKVFRSVGIIKFADRIRFLFMKWKNSADNKRFKQEFPDIPIPPDYILYEAHQIKYRSYFNYGRTNAQKIISLFETYIDLRGKRILDWGCGPARIVRHLPDLLDNAEIHGSDYNHESIEWNSKNIKDVHFSKNNIDPPLEYANNYFDAIYALSIFTHLSEESHHNWIRELARVSKPGGIVILTTHGRAYREKLLGSERNIFDRNELVVQANTLEGHRTYAAYQPPEWFRAVFRDNFDELEHIEGKKEHWGYAQDKWILRAK